MTELVGKVRVHELPTLSEDVTGVVVLASKEQTEYQLPIEKLGGTEVTVSPSANNILKSNNDGLFVNGAHPVVPKIDAKTLSGNMVVEKTFDVNNRLGVSQLSGVSIYSQCLLENKLVYLAADGSIIDAYFYVSNTKTTASTITHTIRVVLAKVPSKVINIDDLSETEVQYENGNLPVKIVIKHLAGTTLSQNGMK